MIANINEDALQERAKLHGSLLLFTQVFYRIRTGREFQISFPEGRESHFLTIAKSLKKVFNGEIKNLYIGVPPRYGKTEMMIHFVAWALAAYPDSNFIYTSYSHTLAKKQTQTIREIINLPDYRDLFGVRLSDETSAKDNFETTAGGSVYAVGAGGTITGRGAGVKGANRFGGAFIMDDMHKPDEAHSDTIREGVIDWFWNTAQSRINDPSTPFIYIGQRVHEDDLPNRLLETGDWESVIIPALDEHKNALYPEMHNRQALLAMQEKSPYVFASQYQQDPQPAGGGIFKPEWFVLLDEEPNILTTFITADTAETEKEYNDASVFSFWGLYRIKQGEIETDLYGLHWIDCLEIRVEPKDLKSEFMNFYASCMRHRVKPKIAAIEKKSTGVTLISVLSDVQGLQIIDIERTSKSKSKTDRFLEAQPYASSKQTSLTRYAKHVPMCVDHMKKITANNTHRFDDIADTYYDAVKVALIDELIPRASLTDPDMDRTLQNILRQNRQISEMKREAYASRRF